MEPEKTTITFFVAIQTSILLGLLHGISPCEHSWPILAPFAVGSKSMKKIMRIGAFFCMGTTTACIFLGATLGMLGSIIPASWDLYIAVASSAVLIILGVILIFKPNLFHFHDEGEHEHRHHHNPDYEDDRHHDTQNTGHSRHYSYEEPTQKTTFKYGLYWGMFSLGFINMMVPCPTAAVMYSYALIAKSIWQSILIFFAYAVVTTAVLMFIAYLLVKASQAVKKLARKENETLITRISGVLIAAFGFYMVIIQFPAFSHLKAGWII